MEKDIVQVWCDCTWPPRKAALCAKSAPAGRQQHCRVLLSRHSLQSVYISNLNPLVGWKVKKMREALQSVIMHMQHPVANLSAADSCCSGSSKLQKVLRWPVHSRLHIK
jgi:hypothetical protein